MKKLPSMITYKTKDYFGGKIPVVNGVAIIYVGIPESLVDCVPSPRFNKKFLSSEDLYDILCQKISEMEYTLTTEEVLNVVPQEVEKSYFETFKYCGNLGEIEFRVNINSTATIDSINFLGVYRAR